MSFTQLVYESRASDSLLERDVFDILHKSQIRNNQLRISGILLFDGQRFVQFIEGPVDQVEMLYARIEADPRHHDLRVLSKNGSDHLLMPTWAMAYASPNVSEGGHEAFTLSHRQAKSICELLPEHVATPFLALLADMAERV